MVGTKKTDKVKKIKKVPEGRGIIHGSFSFNNTKFRLTKENGDALGKMISGGVLGFNNTKKGSGSAAEQGTRAIIELAKTYGIHNVSLHLRGIGVGRNVAIINIGHSEIVNVEEIV